MTIKSKKYGNFNVKVDADTYYDLSKYNWHIRKFNEQTYDCFYVGTRIDGKVVLMHRYLMNAMNSGRNVYVDHINGDTLDNRKENLRIVTPQRNTQNSKTKSINKSGRKGVIWYPYNNVNKWMAYIKVNYKHIGLGYYDAYEEACLAREKAETAYFGEFKNNR